MTLRQKQILSFALLAVALLLMVLGSFVEQISLNVAMVGVVLALIGLLANYWLVRCPFCRAWLGRFPGECCDTCGTKIDYNAKSSSKE